MRTGLRIAIALGAGIAAFGPVPASAAGPEAGASTTQAKPATSLRSRTALGRGDFQVLLSKVTVSDLERSYAFYTQVVGLRRALAPAQANAPPPRNDPERPFIEVALNFSGSLGDTFFDLVQQKGVKPTADFARTVVIGFKVPDAPAVVARARKAGFEIVRDAPVVGTGEMSIGMLRDPDGYMVEIVQSASLP